MLKVVIFLALLPFVYGQGVIESDLKHIVDVCSNGDDYYFLNRLGKVYQQQGGQYQPLEVPDGIIQIQMAGQDLFLLREDGSVWQRSEKGLRLLDGGLPSKQILGQGHKLYILKSNGGLVAYRDGVLSNLVYDRNFEVMAGVGETQLFFLDSWGRLFRYDTYASFLELVDPSPNSIELASGFNMLYVRKKDGTVNKYEDFEFHPLKLPLDVKNMAADGDYLFMVGKDGKLYEFNTALEKLKELGVSGQCTTVRIAGGRLFIMGTEGKLFELALTRRAHSIKNQFHRMWNNQDYYRSHDGFQKSQYRR